MQSKLKETLRNRQTQAAKNFHFRSLAELPDFSSPLHSYSIHRLARLYRQAEHTGNELMRQRVLAEVDSREPLYAFNYFMYFAEVYAQQQQAEEALRA